jgi:hypothetical protein
MYDKKLMVLVATQILMHIFVKLQFLSVLEDTNTEMRQAGHSLLASVHLPNFATFHAIVRALLSSLEHYHKVGGIIANNCILWLLRISARN